LEGSAVPRKHTLTRLSEYKIPDIDSNDRDAIEDIDLVRHALVDFDELGVLSDQAREQLIEGMVDSIRFARTGVKAGKRGLSDRALSQQIFMSDIARALERAGLPAKRWRKKYDNGGGESLLFRMVREIAAVSGIALPQDLKLPGQRAAQHQYGVLSPTMKIMQKGD
jgi:hypothetical protein